MVLRRIVTFIGAAGPAILATACAVSPCDRENACNPASLDGASGAGDATLDGTGTPADGQEPDARVDDAGFPGDGRSTDRDADAAFDDVALAVVSLTPANGDSNVSIRRPIQATFSKPVTLGPMPAWLVGPGSALLASTAALSPDQRTLTLSPLPGVAAPTSLAVALRDVVDGRGSRSPSPAWSWSAPLWLTVASDISDEYYCALAAGPGEQIATAAIQYDADGGSALVVRAAASFDSPWAVLGTPVPAVDDAYGRLPALLVDSAGALVANFVDTTNTLRVVRWSGGAWNDVGGPLDPSLSLSWPSMAASSDGSLFLADQQTFDGGGQPNIVVSSLTGGVWSMLGGVVAQGLAPKIALDRAGRPYVAYVSGQGLYVSQWSGTAWVGVGPGPLNPSTDSGLDEFPDIPSIVIDDGGNTVVVSWILTASSASLRVFRFTGGAWTRVGEPLDSLGYTASLVAGGQGHVYAAWSGGTPAQATIVCADITAAGWTKIPCPSSAPGYGGAGPTALAINPSGAPVLAWGDANDITVACHVRLFNR